MPQQIWVVLKNSNMIEGSGHMLLDKLFLTKETAFHYANRASENGRHSWRHVSAYPLSDGGTQNEYWSNGWGMRQIQYMLAE